MYHELYGHIEFVIKFVIPENDPQWEKRLWGNRHYAEISKNTIEKTSQQEGKRVVTICGSNFDHTCS